MKSMKWTPYAWTPTHAGIGRQTQLLRERARRVSVCLGKFWDGGLGADPRYWKPLQNKWYHNTYQGADMNVCPTFENSEALLRHKR